MNFLVNRRTVDSIPNLAQHRGLLAPALVLGVFAATSVSTCALSGQATQARIERALNVAGLLEQRSPGTRTGAELTKHAREAAAAFRSQARRGETEELRARALGKEFPPEAVSDVTEELGLGSPEQLLALAGPGDVKDFVAPPPAIASRGGRDSYRTLVAFGRDGAPGKPSGLGAGGGGDDVVHDGDNSEHVGESVSTQPTIGIPPAVPEPATWATMLVGMGLCGFALRRRNRLAIQGAGKRCARA